MKISYNEACAKECSTLEKDLVLAEKAGFDFIEIRIDMLRKYLVSHTLDDLKAFFEKSRIKPHAFNAIYIYPEFLSERDNPARQDALLDEFILACVAGKAIGSEYIIVVPPLQRDPNGGPYTGSWDETYKECVRILRTLSDYAAPYGMKLCFELVGFERSSVRSIEAVDKIVRAVDRDNVGFVFDSYNIYLNGGLNDFSALKNVQKEKIFAVHLMSGDDVPASERGQDKRCFCGEGAVDTDAFLRTLREIGYDGMVSVETFRPEYWKQSPEWVIENAYRTTAAAVQKSEEAR